MLTSNDRIEQLEKRLSILETAMEKLYGKSVIVCSDAHENNIVASYNFSQNNAGWKIYNAENVECDGALAFRAIHVERTLGVDYDPMLVHCDVNLPADEIKTVHVRLKANVEATRKCLFSVFFATEKHTDWSQSKCLSCHYAAGKTVDLYMDTKHRYWNGVLKHIRIDPVEGLNGSIEIELAELLDKNGNALFKTDFTIAESLESTGWFLVHSSGDSCDGKLRFNVDALEKKRVYVDPYIVVDGLSVDTSSVKCIHIKMRADVTLCDKENGYIQVLFKTSASNVWNQEKSIRFGYEFGKDIDAYIEIKQLFWKGTLTALRIDPFENVEGMARVKLVEFLREVPKKINIEMLEARTSNLEDRFKEICN